jgi:hypothetical protein
MFFGHAFSALILYAWEFFRENLAYPYSNFTLYGTKEGELCASGYILVVLEISVARFCLPTVLSHAMIAHDFDRHTILLCARFCLPTVLPHAMIAHDFTLAFDKLRINNECNTYDYKDKL